MSTIVRQLAAIALFCTAPVVAAATIQFHFPKQTIGTLQISPSHESYMTHLRQVEACGDITIKPGEAVTVVFHDGRENWIKQLNKQQTSAICGLDFSRCDGLSVTSSDLRNYSEMRLLQLKDSDIGDEAANAIDVLHKLQHLDVSRSKTTVNGLARWLRFGTVKFLLANNIDCRNKDLRFLETACLLEIHLSSTGLTDAGVKALCKGSALRIVSIDKNSGVTDASLQALSTIPHLKELNVSETACTFTGLKKLASCKSLKRLYVSYKRNEQKSFKELISSMPNCEIRSNEHKRITGDPFELFAPIH